MPDADTQVKVTRTCPACRKPLHLVQDNTGSAWYHATSLYDYRCYKIGGGDGS